MDSLVSWNQDVHGQSDLVEPSCSPDASASGPLRSFFIFRLSIDIDRWSVVIVGTGSKRPPDRGDEFIDRRFDGDNGRMQSKFVCRVLRDRANHCDRNVREKLQEGFADGLRKIANRRGAREYDAVDLLRSQDVRN